jgi:hypothetical protein
VMNLRDNTGFEEGEKNREGGELKGDADLLIARARPAAATQSKF